MLVLAVITGCGENKPPRLEKTTIAVLPWPASAPIYIAQEKGYFQGEGLEVTIQPVTTGQEGLNAMLSGSSDFSGAADTPIARTAVSEKPISVIATITHIDQAILIIAKKSSGIEAVDDLKGRKIGVTRGAGAEFFLNIFLTVNHISNQDVQVINIAPDTIVSALLNGEVDAVSTWSPHYLELQNKLGSDALILTDPTLYTQTWNLVVTQDFARKNPEKIEKLLRAIIQANRFIQGNPQEARSISSRYIGTDSSIYETDWMNYHFTATLEQSFLLNLEDQARWMLQSESGERKVIPNFLDYIYTDGLKKVQPGNVRVTK